jgi:hypothetical protein
LGGRCRLGGGWNRIGGRAARFHRLGDLFAEAFSHFLSAFPKLTDSFANAAADFRQPPWPKNEQRHDSNNNKVNGL